jgi:ATP-binding cassette subfamily B protein
MTMLKEQDYNKKIDWNIWKSLYNFAKPHKSKFIKLILLMITLGVIDVIFPLLSKYAIDNFATKKDLSNIGVFIFVYFTIIIIQVFNIWLFIGLAGKISTSLSYDIRKDGFKKLQEFSFSYYDKNQVGWIMTRMTSDIKKIGEIFAWGIVDIVWGFTLMIAIMIAMLYLNWKLALIVIMIIPLLVIISFYFQNKILKSYRKVRKTNSKITGAFNEGIMGAKTIKTLVREEENLGEFTLLVDKMQNYSIKAAVLSSLYFPLILIIGSIGTGIVIWYGGNGVVLKAISYGSLVAFISYTIHFFEPVMSVARVFAEFQNAQASAERVVSMIKTEIDIKDSKEVIDKYGDFLNPQDKNWPKSIDDIVFENVGFHYTEGESILSNFNLKIKAGEKIALVGETGSGKTTIVNLICRFYEPTFGRILINGKDYKEMSLVWLQSNLGYVLQSPHLFSGTIMENIRYGNLNATDQEVKNAAKLVNADIFIEKLEQKYNTEVEEGGNSLSTGEKQLISFARAILANPQIFILDEATSSIDTETELIIQDAIDKLLNGRTSFIIAHRLSTIRSADRILVIKNGKIKEEGSHKFLIDKKGHYYNLYMSQFIDEEESKILNI